MTALYWAGRGALEWHENAAPAIVAETITSAGIKSVYIRDLIASPSTAPEGRAT